MDKLVLSIFYFLNSKNIYCNSINILSLSHSLKLLENVKIKKRQFII